MPPIRRVPKELKRRVFYVQNIRGLPTRVCNRPISLCVAAVSLVPFLLFHSIYNARCSSEPFPEGNDDGEPRYRMQTAAWVL